VPLLVVQNGTCSTVDTNALPLYSDTQSQGSKLWFLGWNRTADKLMTSVRSRQRGRHCGVMSKLRAQQGTTQRQPASFYWSFRSHGSCRCLGRVGSLFFLGPSFTENLRDQQAITHDGRRQYQNSSLGCSRTALGSGLPAREYRSATYDASAGAAGSSELRAGLETTIQGYGSCSFYIETRPPLVSGWTTDWIT
jgi:hypothetical protein